MFNTIRIIKAFIIRDFKTEMGYSFGMAFQIIGIISHILIFYFIAKLVGDRAISYLGINGTDYFSFVLIGIAFSNYLSTGLSCFSEAVRREQLAGTLEMLFVTPANFSLIIFASSMYSLIYTLIETCVYLAAGAFLFGVSISGINIFGVLLVLLLTFISFSGLGIMSASFILAFKKGDPINYFINTLFILLGGVYYPVSILPGFLQSISVFLPLTHALNALRLLILKGTGINAVLPCIFALLIFSIILLPLSLILFNLALKKVKEKGTLYGY